MTVTADASFLVSLYGGDMNTPTARAWMAANATPVILTQPLRFETENALRLATFRGKIPPEQLRTALADISNDLAAGILIHGEIPATRLWQECIRLSATHTLSEGSRALDIL